MHQEKIRGGCVLRKLQSIVKHLHGFQAWCCSRGKSDLACINSAVLSPKRVQDFHCGSCNGGTGTRSASPCRWEMRGARCCDEGFKVVVTAKTRPDKRPQFPKYILGSTYFSAAEGFNKVCALDNILRMHCIASIVWFSSTCIEAEQGLLDQSGTDAVRRHDRREKTALTLSSSKTCSKPDR